jgi:hypothetical protein
LKVVLVTGGFDPLHIIEKRKANPDILNILKPHVVDWVKNLLVVGINNKDIKLAYDAIISNTRNSISEYQWLARKKGQAFMPASVTKT